MPGMTHPTEQQLDDLGAALEEFSRRYKLAAARESGRQVNELDKLILLHLARNPGAKPTDIARLLGVPATTTTSATDRLVKRGMIERHRPEADRRAVSLTLSDAGAAHVSALARIYRDLQSQMLAPLTPEERDTLIRLMSKIVNSET